MRKGRPVKKKCRLTYFPEEGIKKRQGLRRAGLLTPQEKLISRIIKVNFYVFKGRNKIVDTIITKDGF